MKKIFQQIKGSYHLTENEAKKELSRLGLDYTFLPHLFMSIDVGDKILYVKVLNFDFCIKLINEKKDMQKYIPRTTW